MKVTSPRTGGSGGGGGGSSYTGAAPISVVGTVISIGAATDSAAGSMSAADKTKLDTLAATQVSYADATSTPAYDAATVQVALDDSKAAASYASETYALVSSGPINAQKPGPMLIIGSTLWYYEIGNGTPAICAYDISTPSAPSFLSRHLTVTEGYLNYNFLASGTRGYVPVQDTHSVATGGILVYDLSNGATGASLLGYYTLPDAGAKPYDMALDPTVTYAVIPSNLTVGGGLYIVNVSNPASMTLVGTKFGTSSPNNRYTSVAWVGTHIFACSETNNVLEVWDVSTVTSPSLVFSYTFSSDSTASLVRVMASPDGKTLYLYRDGPNMLSVWDITTPTAPASVADLPFGSIYLGEGYFSADGQRFYQSMNAASADPGPFRCVDVQNRAAPRIMGEGLLPVASNVGAALPHPTQPYVYVSDHVVGQLLTYSITRSPRRIPSVSTKTAARTFTGVLVTGLSDYMTLADGLVAVNATATAVTEYLPDARSCPGQSFKAVKTDSSGNAVTLKTQVSAQKIGTTLGTTGIVLAAQGNAVTVTSDGTQFWQV